MSLEAPAVLAALSPWLTCRELCAVRALNRECHTVLPRQTWELTVCHVTRAATLAHLAKTFPHVWRLRLQRVALAGAALMQALASCLAANWELRELELVQIGGLRDGHLRILSAEWPALEKLSVCQCFQVQTPAIISPGLRSLVIENCRVTHFHADTRLPSLRELSLSSHQLTTLEARHLTKHVLANCSSLEVLRLANCSQLEQVLVDPDDLPALKTLDLGGCTALNRVHVASRSLETLELSPADQLQVVVLDVRRLLSVDLSFLTNLTHLFIRSPSLHRLNLRGCNRLTQEATSVDCPKLQLVVLQGTSLAVDDLRKKVDDL